MGGACAISFPSILPLSCSILTKVITGWDRHSELGTNTLPPDFCLSFPSRDGEYSSAWDPSLEWGWEKRAEKLENHLGLPSWASGPAVLRGEAVSWIIGRLAREQGSSSSAVWGPSLCSDLLGRSLRRKEWKDTGTKNSLQPLSIYSCGCVGWPLQPAD